MFERIQALCPLPLTLTWHENSCVYFSCRKRWRRLHLRLHRAFAGSPDALFQALFSYILKKDPRAKADFRKAAELCFSKLQLPSRPLNAQGKVYDLGAIYERMKEQFFPPDYQASIGWSDRRVKSTFRHITFGTYDRRRRQIRIHPLLDQAEVPPLFVEFIVYHEMLHGVCPSLIDARGCVRPHTAEFRRREKLHPHYREAKAWQKKSLLFFREHL